MTVEKRLNLLRQLFDPNNIDGYIVPTTDEYMSEYTAPYAKRLEYITGFTGSNGMAVILRDKVLLFTDGRYLSQAVKQLGEGFEIYNLNEIKAQLGKEILGFDPMLFTEAQLSAFSNSQGDEKVLLKPIRFNLIDQIWEAKPSHPATKIYQYATEYAGEESDSKLMRLRQVMRDKEAQHCLLTSADSICWLLNIRAADIECCPLMLGYCVVGLEEVWLFNQDSKNPKPSELPAFLESLSGKCMVDKTSCPVGLFSFIKDILPSKDPCQLMKALKHKSEILGSANAHIKDSVALCETLAWLCESLANNDEITEYDIGLKLTEFRSKQEGYVMDSFSPIVGFKDNGAIIHYKAEKDSAKIIKGSGLLLIDSGGHYLGGTTDVTRTIAIGAPTDEQKERYTDVLKGHIALANQKFPSGTCGQALDVLARMYLWQNGLDYAHGTGHGVGNFLSVHEGPQRINQVAVKSSPLYEGMIVSNEPGFYKVGEYGIRIENLVYVKNMGEFLGFENLTIVPYCIELIDQARLSEVEKQYLKTYNERFMELIYPLLSSRAKAWAMSAL